MSVDPLVIQAAHTYVGQPCNYGTDTNLIRLAEIDAFIAGVEWATGHQGTHT